MSLATIIIRLSATVFAVYGLGFIVAPEGLAVFVTGSAPAPGPALTDLRATYGGMSLAVGIILFLLASDTGNTRPGLLAVMLLMLGMAAGRSYGILVDGDANLMMYLYLGLEVAVAAISGWLWRTQDKGNQ